MDVSIILVSYNTKNLTRDCIKSVYEKTLDISYDIWVCDNASSDGSIDMIKKEFPNFKKTKTDLIYCQGSRLYSWSSYDAPKSNSR